MTEVSTSLTTSQDEITRWSGWPLRQRPAVGLLILGALLLAAYGTWEASPWITPLAVGVPVLVNGRFFFPTRFEATAQGLAATHPTFAPRRIRWDEVDRIVLDRPGVWLVVPTKTHRFSKACIMPVYEDMATPRVASILANHWEPQA
jgi:hypothetical protein